VSASSARALDIPRTVTSDGVALTFDDGPHPEGTTAVLDILEAAGHKATFFMVGEQVERRPSLAREVTDRGHLIALHGHRHRLQLKLSARELALDLDRGRAAIVDAVGADVSWHRPPYGVYSPAGLRAARTAGLKPLLWSRWGKDWRRFTTPERIARRVTRGLEAGDVILLHDADFYSARDSHRRTTRAVEMIVAELKVREIATVLPV
jgi:peptidoglycan/xylan/chitin deacetylase (PgdA/CDA1 family)